MRGDTSLRLVPAGLAGVDKTAMDRHALRARDDAIPVIASAAKQSTSARQSLWAALALSLALATPAVQAQASQTSEEAALCIIEPQQAGNTTPAMLQRWLAAVPGCQKNPLFLAALGRLLNNQGRYQEAADHLERALLLDPGLKDAQLSYAIALAGSGDAPSASALLADLLADPALPAELRPLIARQQAALAETSSPAPSGWQSRFVLAARLGHDSNLLGSPNLGSLALTLSGQTLVLPLDESYRARSGSYARADAQIDLYRTGPDGVRWDAVVSLRQRHSPDAAESGSTQGDLLLERSHPTGGSYVNVNASALQARSGTRYQMLGLAAGWSSALGPGCLARAGGEAQERSYLDNPLLSGRYTGFSVFWTCAEPAGRQWLLGGKVGLDAAQDVARPGGDQQLASVRAAAYWPLAGAAVLPAAMQRGAVLLDAEVGHQQDTSGYSPIIESGRSRRIWRRAARLEYQHPAAGAAQWVLGIEWMVQTSNLELFRLDNWGGYAGLRVGW